MGISLFRQPKPDQAYAVECGVVAEPLRAPVFHDLAPGTLALAAAVLDELGLPRLLRLMIAGSIPPLWYEIALLHYRGSFQSPFMWLPLAYLPLEMVGGALAGANDTRTTRALFRALSCGTVALGTLGTLLHIRGVRRQMGGLAEWRSNVMTGPPIVAPPQVTLFGLIGVLGTSGATTRTIIRRLRRIAVMAQLLLATEAGYSHYQNYYANMVQYAPVLLAAAQVAALASSNPTQRIGRRAEVVLSGAAALAGLVGCAFHFKNVRSHSGGFSWQNLFYGAPLVAPLQLSGQGLLGLLAAYFDRRGT